MFSTRYNRDFTDLTKRTAFDKILRDKAFNIAKNSKYDGYQSGLVLMVYKCFDKKTSGSSIKNENYVSPAISKFTKRKGNASFIDNI